MNFELRTVLFLVVVGISMCIVEDACADEFKLTPSLAVKEEYNDNVLYNVTDAVRDYVTTVSPEFSFLQKTERSEVNLTGKLDIRSYTRNQEFNATDQYFSGSGRYDVNELLSITGKASYSIDSRSDRDMETTGFPLTNVKRASQNYGISTNFLLAENSTFGIAYDYSNDDYYSNRYADSEVNSVGVRFERGLSSFVKPTKARWGFTYAKYNITGMGVADYGGTLGINQKINENWNLTFDVGLRYTQMRFETQNLNEPNDESNGWGGLGKITLLYRGKVTSFDFYLSHGLEPASGRFGTSERTAVSFVYDHKFTYEIRGILSGGLYVNKSRKNQYSLQSIDENSMRMRPSLRYDFSNDMTLEASLSYTRSNYKVSDERAQRVMYFLSLSIKHELFN